MKRYFTFSNYLAFLSLTVSTLVPVTVSAAPVSLASAPLAQSSSSSVQPNIMFVLDNSGSMSWTYLPDITDNFRGGYGYQSNQCNGVYYNPNTTYAPPLKSDSTPYANAVFNDAYDDGFDTTTTKRDLNSAFIANRFVDAAANTSYVSFGSYLKTGTNPYGGSNSLGPYGAVYYDYSGTVTDKDYANTGSAFYTECNVAVGAATTKFAKRKLATDEKTTITVTGSTNTAKVDSILVGTVELMYAASAATSPSAANDATVASNIKTQINNKTSITGFSATVSGNVITVTGPATAANQTPAFHLSAGSATLTTDVFPETAAAKLTNFANWYSYYRTRMQTMKSSAGRAFSNLDNSYRVGLMKINSSTTPVQELGTFESTHRSTWYSSFYAVQPNGGTPLREALSNVGQYYAGRLSGTTDPAQYSCQQNFTILSTDGYWNGNDGSQLDGSAIGNQDGTASRSSGMYDGSVQFTKVTKKYLRHSYSASATSCSGSKKRGVDTPQTQTCSITTTGGVAGAETCTAWANGTAVYMPGFSSSTSTCATTVSLPTPNPTARVETTSATTSGIVAGTGSSDSLSDVAMYYYNTDLRTTTLGNCTSTSGNTLCADPDASGVDIYDNVYTGGRDNNTKQHMTTFTLGLGADGFMKYSANYLKGGSADYNAIITVTTAHPAASPSVCSWQADGTTCNWPTPGGGGPENIDDLWHAAVNGRGTYFSARDPSSLTSGIASALAGIESQKGAAAAAATSSLNPVAGNNAVYIASYNTGLWTGNLESRSIDVATGDISSSADWCIETIGSCIGTLSSKVTTSSDTRTIKTANSTGTGLINFDASYALANPSYFNTSRISTLSQWSSLTSAQQSAAVGPTVGVVSTGANLINYLRGQSNYDDSPANAGTVAGIPFDNRVFRKRDAILGDTLESEPTYSGAPVFSYAYPGYSELVGDTTRPAGGYKKVQASRAGMVYIAANDGMLHAFSASAGEEKWAYVPSMVIPDMWRLADKNYTALHHNYINGSPIISDVCTANCASVANAVWKTILVGGLNAGGRGYYALDITNPLSPTLLWEITTTSGIGIIKDDDIGYSYGQPIITRKKNTDGTYTWVVIVSSGYNNTSPGDGKGHLYMLDAQNGTILSKVLASATVGSTIINGDGLAKIQGLNAEPAGNLISYVYGGDLLGNVWRFDVNDPATAETVGSTATTGKAVLLAILKDPSGNTQPITVTPILGKSNGETMVFVGTGQYLGAPDLSTTQIQTQYAIKDRFNTVGTLNNPAGSPRNTATLRRSTLSLVSGTTDRITALTGASADKGWYADFDISSETGERVNVDGKLIQGILIIPSTVPSNTACSPGGHGWLNYFDYETGGAVGTSVVSHRYDATIAGIFDYYINGELKVKVVESNGTLGEGNPPPTGAASDFQGVRTLWRELIQP